MNKQKIAIVGAGTVIFKDEGVGVFAQKYLDLNYKFYLKKNDEKSNESADVTIVDGGVLGFQLMVYYQEYDKVIILDTITMQDDKAGSIYNLPADKLLGLGSYKQTAHEVEIVEMLEICSLLENFAETNIIGIVPDDIASVVTDLSDTLKAQFYNFIQETINELKRAGINSIQNETIISLEEIINSYANPTAQRDLAHLK